MKIGTCAITGANGFVGRALSRRFREAGWRAIHLVRKPTANPLPDVEERAFVLGQPIALPALAGADLLIHAAYDFSLCGWNDICRVNVMGSEYLFDTALRAGVKRQIFISSMAAFEGCRSHYGRGKLTAEEAVRARGGISIRPGVIYSEQSGGIFGKIQNVARKFPIIPMIGHGHYPLYTCHVEDLATLLLDLAYDEGTTPPVLFAANDTPVTLHDLAKGARGDGNSPLIVPVPWQLMAAGLWTLERMGLRLGFRSDSVVSLVHGNRQPDFHSTAGRRVKFRPFTGIPEKQN